MVRITGWYQLPNALPQQVDFAELFDASFMRRFTRYRSFEKFLAGALRSSCAWRAGLASSRHWPDSCRKGRGAELRRCFWG